jgi:Skp family chaperone for outer membrane proteins
MTVRTLMLLLCVSLFGLAGCDRLTRPDAAAGAQKGVGGVGVVDLDSVAKQLGRDVEMNNTVQERMNSLNNKLSNLKTSLGRLYDEKRAGFGEDLDEDQQKQLATMQDRMDAQLVESGRKAKNELAVLKQQLIDQFREQTKPVLKEVAADRGLSIVVPKNNGLLLSIDPAVEITDEVAKRMLAAQAPAEKPAAAKSKRPASTETSAR